jgi:hypothetical protein
MHLKSWIRIRIRIHNTNPWVLICLPGAQGRADVITVLHSCDGLGEQVLQLNSVPVLIAALLVVGPNMRLNEIRKGNDVKFQFTSKDEDPG